MEEQDVSAMARERKVISTHPRMSLAEGLMDGLMKTRVFKELANGVESAFPYAAYMMVYGMKEAVKSSVD